jgi:hypothetical protein
MFIEGAFQTENRASTLILHRDVQTKFVDPTTIEFPLCGRYSPKFSLAAPNAVFWNPSGINAEESGVDYLDLQSLVWSLLDRPLQKKVILNFLVERC